MKVVMTKGSVGQIANAREVSEMIHIKYHSFELCAKRYFKAECVFSVDPPLKKQSKPVLDGH